MVGYLQRLLQLKYPDLQSHVTLSRAQEMVASHTYMALDYSAELREWAEGRHDGHVRAIQLPYTQVHVVCMKRFFLIIAYREFGAPIQVPPLSQASSLLVDPLSRGMKERQKKQKAREQLLKLNQKKKEEKVLVSSRSCVDSQWHCCIFQIGSYEAQLEGLLMLQQQQELVDPEEYQLILEEAGFTSHESLQQATATLQTNLESEQKKLSQLLNRTEEVTLLHEYCLCLPNLYPST